MRIGGKIVISSFQRSLERVYKHNIQSHEWLYYIYFQRGIG